MTRRTPSPSLRSYVRSKWGPLHDPLGSADSPDSRHHSCEMAVDSPLNNAIRRWENGRAALSSAAAVGANSR
jgi:hypothetical protein